MSTPTATPHPRSPLSVTKPPKKPKAFRVGPCGVYVVRGPRDDLRFYFQATRTVLSERITVWSGWATKAEAGRAVAAAVASLPPDEPGERVVSAPMMPDPRRYTIAELLCDWMSFTEARSDLREGTRVNYRGAVARLTERIGAYPLAVVSIEHTQGYINARVAERIARRGASRELEVLRTAWRWGVKARKHNEPLHCPVGTSRYIVRDRPTEDDAWAAFDALQSVKVPEWSRRAFGLLLLTGARTSEAWCIAVGGVDLEAGTVTIPDQELCKTGGRTVQITQDGVEILRPWVVGRRPTERLIGEVSHSAYMNSFGRFIRRACEDVGVKPFTGYGLRRLAVDTYLDRGVDPGVEAVQLGHSPEMAAKLYRYVRADRAKAGAIQAGLGVRPVRKPEGVVVPFEKRRA